MSGCEFAAKRVGAQEAEHLVLTRPMGILKDQLPSSLPRPRGVADLEAAELAEHRRSRVRSAAEGDDAVSLRGLARRLRRFFE
jgi:protein-tyrosine phosphatase